MGDPPSMDFLERFGLVLSPALPGHRWRGLVDALFMVRLSASALALLLGVEVRIAAICGAVMLASLMWSTSLPPSDDVFMDNHLIYALLLFGLVFVGAVTPPDSAAGGRRPPWCAASPRLPEADPAFCVG